ncbi:MAG: hypothetical protein ACREQD_02130, partial [Candidatus Binataceae bacterium]
MERSLKEAASELKARVERGSERRFPVMGLKGAANALMIREVALTLNRPLIVIAPLAAQAEALASELAFFLDQPPDADPAQDRLHLLPSWELRPFAQLSPPCDLQAAQLAALFALTRTPAPTVVTSVEALMMRTIPRSAFDRSVFRITFADRVDLDALIDALGAMGYQRVPQTEERGDFSVRGGIVDVFSPLHHHPVRFELEEDQVTSIRHFDAASQRSLGEIEEATIIRTRYVPAAALRENQLGDRVAIRCAEIGMVRKETAELLETIENGLLFPGVELLTPYLYESGLQSVFDYVPEQAVAWMLEPCLILAEDERLIDRLDAEAAAAQAKPVFYPAPATLYLRLEELERALSATTAVEAGSLITVAAPREGWAPPIAIKSQPSLRLGAVE